MKELGREGLLEDGGVVDVEDRIRKLFRKADFMCDENDGDALER